MKSAALLGLLFFLTACSATVAQNEDCARQTPPDSRYRWGYYAGHGCGPITPGVTAPFG
jgi:hypothetical protein